MGIRVGLDWFRVLYEDWAAQGIGIKIKVRDRIWKENGIVRKIAPTQSKGFFLLLR